MKKTIRLLMFVTILIAVCACGDDNGDKVESGKKFIHYDNQIISLDEGLLKVNKVGNGYVLFDLILYSINYNIDNETGALVLGYGNGSYMQFTICVTKTIRDINGDGILTVHDLLPNDITLSAGKYNYSSTEGQNITFVGAKISIDDPKNELYTVESGTLEVKTSGSSFIIEFDGVDTKGKSVFCNYTGKIKYLYGNQVLS